MKRVMTRRAYFARLWISVAIDLVDATVGRIPAWGMIGDGMGTAAMLFLWGWPGLFNLAELLDPTEQIDGFIPTATIVALVIGIREGHLFGKKDATEGAP